jgi:hypothetical protein
LDITPDYQIKYKDIEGEKIKILNLVTNKERDLSAPINFRLLILPEANKVYRYINCKVGDIYSLTMAADGIICWDDKCVVV